MGCPAEHDTYADRHLPLPNDKVCPDRDFGGQRFVRHVAQDALWQPRGDLLVRDSGISQGTGGMASVVTVRLGGKGKGTVYDQPPHGGEFFLLFITKGVVDVVIPVSTSMGGGDSREEEVHRLQAGTSITLPSTHHLTATAVITSDSDSGGGSSCRDHDDWSVEFIVVQLPPSRI